MQKIDKNMKKILFCVALMMVNVCTIYAQKTEDKDLMFVYIAHTNDVPLKRLTSILKEHYRFGVQFFNDVIFYMSNGDDPLIVKVNTTDDNKNDFENMIIDELWNKRSHDINPSLDVENIIDIINKNDFIDEDSNLKYMSVTFEFYASNSFWTMNYNESIISKLYFALDINKLKQKNEELMFNVYYPSDNKISFENNLPFGTKNLENINNNIMLLTY